MPSTQNVSRREFLLMASAASGAAVGALAFPQSARVVEAAGPGAQRVTNSYARVKIAKLDDLETWQPIDFEYPLEMHRNFLVKLGVSASDGGWAGRGHRSLQLRLLSHGLPADGAVPAAAQRHRPLPVPLHHVRLVQERDNGDWASHPEPAADHSGYRRRGHRGDRRDRACLRTRQQPDGRRANQLGAEKIG